MITERTLTIGMGKEHVLVMHDWFSDCTSYHTIIPYLDFQRFTYAFFDLRGYGKSIEITGSYTLDEVSADCIALVDALKWKQFHVVGHSMTGLTAQHLNALITDRILSVTAVTPVPARGSDIPPEFIEIIKQGVAGNDQIMMEIIKGTSGGIYSDGFYQDKLRQFRQSASVEARLGYLKMFSENDITDMVKGLETPFHVIIGSRDSEWHNREVMESTFGVIYPNCVIEEISDASHFPMQETPVMFASTLERYPLHACVG